MKLTMSKVALLITGALIASPAAQAQSKTAGKAYAELHCNWCHSTEGRGYSVAPKLTGQLPAYIGLQLRRFWSKPDPHSETYMAHVPRTDRRTTRAIGAYYFNLTPTPAANGNMALMSEGKRIYDYGVTPFVVSCAFCHGPKGQGIRAIPRLGGQSYYYLKLKLSRWVQGHDTEASRMPALSVNLTNDQIEALSSYLSFVR
jgi:cytochrome c553